MASVLLVAVGLFACSSTDESAATPDVLELDSQASDSNGPIDTSSDAADDTVFVDTVFVDTAAELDITPVPDSADVAVDTTVAEPVATPIFVSSTSAEIEVATVTSSNVVAAVRLGEGIFVVTDDISDDPGFVGFLDGGSLVEWGPAPSDLRDLTAIDSDTALLLAPSGIWVATAEEIVLSPLTEALADQVPNRVAVEHTESGTHVWLAGADGVHVWSNGQVFPLQIQDVNLADAHVVVGPNFDGQPAVWFGTATGLVAIAGRDDLSTAWTVREELSVDAMAGDDAGRLWVLASGELHRRQTNASWTWWSLPTPALNLVARTDQAGVFVETAGHLWFTEDDAWRTVMDAPALLFDIDLTGRALVGTPSGLVRIGVDAEPEPEPDPVTWGGDVEPLFVQNCAKCHGDGKYAHPLFSRQQWIDEIDLIRLVVQSQAMPLPPNPVLTAPQLKVIADWQGGGFLP